MLCLPDNSPSGRRLDAKRGFICGRRSLPVDFYITQNIIYGGNTMFDKQLKRPKPLKVYVNADEEFKIRNRMQEAKVKNITNYMRRMALDGEIRTYDFSSVKEGLLPIGEYSVALNRIGNNINQISKKANETDVIDNEDIQYLSSQVHDMKQNYEAVIKKLTQEITRLRTK
ncbi:plasmid mobilization protein [Lactococcus garvieae]|uniref:plasmid mobilization protein n=1 Tax=Lactococcus garvieae TaxID=1363 RepID=UPI003853BAA6